MALGVANKMRNKSRIRLDVGRFRVTSLPVDMNIAKDRTRIKTESAARPSLRERVRQAAIKTESAIIREALERHRWNRRKTAEALRISYRSLMYKMKHCNLRDDEPAEQLLDGESPREINYARII